MKLQVLIDKKFEGNVKIQSPTFVGFLFIKGSNSHYRYTGQTLVIEETQPAK